MLLFWIFWITVIILIVGLLFYSFDKWITAYVHKTARWKNVRKYILTFSGSLAALILIFGSQAGKWQQYPQPSIPLQKAILEKILQSRPNPERIWGYSVDYNHVVWWVGSLHLRKNNKKTSLQGIVIFHQKHQNWYKTINRAKEKILYQSMAQYYSFPHQTNNQTIATYVSWNTSFMSDPLYFIFHLPPRPALITPPLIPQKNREKK